MLHNKILFHLFASLNLKKFDLEKNQAEITIKHGLINSEGCIVIIPKTDIHLDAPPLVKPIINVNKTPSKLIINKTKDIFLEKFLGNIEIVTIKEIEINKKIVCLIRKKY